MTSLRGIGTQQSVRKSSDVPRSVRFTLVGMTQQRQALTDRSLSLLLFDLVISCQGPR